MKSTILSIIGAVLILSGAVYLSNSMSSSSGKTPPKVLVPEENIHNVSIVDGKQIIEINTKG